MLLFFILLVSSVFGLEWRNIESRIDPPTVSKPECVAVDHRIICINGMKDQCSNQQNYWNNNRLVYVFDTIELKGTYKYTTGDIPQARAFGAAWKSDEGKLIMGGGMTYSFDYSWMENHDFNVMYELDANTWKWSEVNTLGDVPSPRSESSYIVDPNNENIVYLFGGVATTGGFNFIGYSDIYVYNNLERKFTYIDSLNQTRYHAHMFKFGNELHISQGVSRVNITTAIELSSTVVFNLVTHESYENYPNPPLPYQRRHGVQFQLGDYGCLFSGDVNVPNRTICCGCLFATYTDTKLYCNNFNVDGWVEISGLVSGEAISSKYPASAIVDNKLFVFSGQDMINNEQVFHDSVRVLDFN